MAGEHWRSHVVCLRQSCDGKLDIEVRFVGEYKAFYSYTCSQCHESGDWTQLARIAKSKFRRPT